MIEEKLSTSFQAKAFSKIVLEKKGFFHSRDESFVRRNSFCSFQWKNVKSLDDVPHLGLNRKRLKRGKRRKVLNSIHYVCTPCVNINI
jgi:hypothetical protein